MKWPRYKARWASDEYLAADHALRKAVRSVIREVIPDADRPPGGGWLYTASPTQCPACDAYLFMVRVPDSISLTMGYCPDCATAFVWDELV